ncbi:TetR/AcrR family transcriptional regulator [Frankia sp. CNm7]|uniref:TetR/AcrR family transcriptional regulator n=1 Tax=Frankia nepalensis TaxID=1836974 RepID=A0A937RJ31_9ACTN|nr:TetR/AcrR family transcriptional regulator [Frankia nepalensis]MBL7499222.1 TetR/AcrR family transcriptional regulator [Frankia nepalensis]MBL7512132.1 TetR/AcrR family transcriptional regulator [Frankia nepalensis]MBL7520903.1 TetR/AcrR family transcriptional regulator [Frankia nepalensis]MBL7627293.1 TetR/AcrR family transcriptional regulator [Frankia nepalensis]
MTAASGRVRDPERRDKILVVAAELIAARGYHAVTMAEIGQAAGIVGSGVYRHFESKAQVLSALLDRTMTELLDDAARVVDAGHDSATTMLLLVRAQVDFSIDHRDMVGLYRREAPTLPADEGRRLRRMQRRYNEEWVTTLGELRPELSDAAAQTLVHAAIGAIQSVVSYDSGLSRPDLVTLLTTAALACLGLRDHAAVDGPAA